MLTGGHLYIYIPICSMYGIFMYIYLHDWVILSANVGKYSSTMEHMVCIYIYVHSVMILFSVLSWTINRISTSALEHWGLLLIIPSGNLT